MWNEVEVEKCEIRWFCWCIYEEWSKKNADKRNIMEIGESEMMMGFGYVDGVIVNRRG